MPDHYNRIHLLHIKNDISITKATHAARHFAAQTARAHGASVTGTKALGRWSETDAMTNCYDRQIPIDALLGASMFNSRRPEEHFLARELLGMLMVSLLLSGDANVVGPLEPPAELISQIFPWVEAEHAALEEREHRLGRPAQDIALRQFLHLLVWLRRVLLQDVAMLFSQKPACPVFQFPLFHSTSFRSFAEHSQKIVAQAIEDTHLNAQNLPDQFVASVQGAMASVQLNQDARMEQLEHSLQASGNR